MVRDAHVDDLRCPRDSETVTLRDGSHVVIRTLCSGEAPIIREIFDGMSEESRRQRFIGPKPSLSTKDLELLASIDHENHLAVVALDPVTGRALGEAHLVRDSVDPGVAEIAFGVSIRGRAVGSAHALPSDSCAVRASSASGGSVRHCSPRIGARRPCYAAKVRSSTHASKAPRSSSWLR